MHGVPFPLRVTPTTPDALGDLPALAGNNPVLILGACLGCVADVAWRAVRRRSLVVSNGPGGEPGPKCRMFQASS